MPRYYYTCPIKALYMMKEFGVEFEIENEDFEDEDDGFTEPYFDFRLWEIESPETINTLLDILEGGGRIYVQYESRHIFEPKTNDIFSYKMFGMVTTYILPENQDGKEWAKEVSEIKIIMRDDKEFFMPEVEND